MISILTPSYHRDFERCKLLCESIDKRVTGFANHYIIVNDDDFALFLPLAGKKRVIMKYSDVIPSRLKVIPRWFKQDYWVSWNARPLKGWHVQQIVKIAAFHKFSEERICLVDSDLIFIRPFDLAKHQSQAPVHFHTQFNVIPRNKPLHTKWVENSRKLLGFPLEEYPVNDYIGNMIFWDKSTVLAMCNRIEEVTGLEWSTALNRVYSFSEFLIYGNFVNDTPEFKAKHKATDEQFFHTYWSKEALTEATLAEFLSTLEPQHVTIGIQSFTDTPLELLRTLIK